MVTQRALEGRQTDKRRDGSDENGKDDQVASWIECIFLSIEEDGEERKNGASRNRFGRLISVKRGMQDSQVTTCVVGWMGWVQDGADGDGMVHAAGETGIATLQTRPQLASDRPPLAKVMGAFKPRTPRS